MEVKAKTIEEREIRAMDDLLPSLYQSGLLTDIECRIIVCSRKLEEKQLALFRMMIFKNKQTAAQLIEMFRVMNYNLHAEEKLNLQESDNNYVKNELDSTFEAGKNPMLNNTVIQCVFGFLALEDIKNCRLVSRQWNSTAEILLRKRAKIHFRTDGLRPETFLSVSKFSLPDLPFSAFKFSEESANVESSWREPELEDFFEKWGGNIKELDLSYKNIVCTDAEDNYDVTPWLKNACKITSLKMESSEDDDEELMSLSLGDLDYFSKIKTFIMIGNIFETCSEKIIRMAPENIELSNITYKRNKEILKKFRCNDFFDFSQAVTIRLNNENIPSKVTLDMRNLVFKKTDVLYLNEIAVKHWKEAKGTVRHVELIDTPFTEKNQLKIKSLQISDSEIDLFALPQTVERVEIYNCNISCSQSLSLPKLKFLTLQLKSSVSYQLELFRLGNCGNLKELELLLSNYGDEMTSLTRMFDFKKLPKNLQALRIKGNLHKYLADDWILEIPGIIVLDATYYGSLFSDYTRIAEKLHAGTLVLVCNEYMEINTDDIVRFLLLNMKGEPKRIIIGMKDENEEGLHAQTRFQNSWISSIVDAKSNYYEFENLFGIVGKAITRDQFMLHCQ